MLELEMRIQIKSPIHSTKATNCESWWQITSHWSPQGVDCDEMREQCMCTSFSLAL